MGERARTATDTDGLLLGDLAPGARIGDYRIEGPLPSVGAGMVYAATHLLLTRKATVKVMPAAHPWSRTLAMQVLREALIVEQLDHPGIPRVYECGVLPDRRVWLAIERIEGRPLSSVLCERTMTPLQVAELIRDVAGILAHVHERGLVHGRVRLSTIVVPDQRRRYPLALTDWTLVRARDSRAPAPLRIATDEQAYIAPEQARGDAFDGRSDLYALGVVAHRALVGALPSDNRPVPPDAPPMLVALIEQLLAANPAARSTAEKLHQTASWLVGWLGEIRVPASAALLDDLDEPEQSRAKTSPFVPRVDRGAANAFAIEPATIIEARPLGDAGIDVDLDEVEEADIDELIEPPPRTRTISSDRSSVAAGEISAQKPLARIAIARVATPIPRP